MQLQLLLLVFSRNDSPKTKHMFAAAVHYGTEEIVVWNSIMTHKRHDDGCFTTIDETLTNIDPGISVASGRHH